ncbi:hypothetical protein JJC00_06690 [Bradyrhizobium diazoefficiens]|nr:hypothetical protein [Bradyrhizobium diazoefficiens]QQO35361.1 hypothetical protein JJC00_06690 [Bradyrhizobium diazoefficiens]
MFTVAQMKASASRAVQPSSARGRKKTAHDSDREYHFVRFDDPSLLRFAGEGRRATPRMITLTYGLGVDLAALARLMAARL